MTIRESIDQQLAAAPKSVKLKLEREAQKMENTPTPWKLHPINGGFFDSEGTKVNILSRVNAAYIVRAVNAHEALVDDLKQIVNNPNVALDPMFLAMFRRHIAKAEGK